MIIQRWDIEILRRGKLFYLLSPARDQSITFLEDERREFINIVERHWWFGPRRNFQVSYAHNIEVNCPIDEKFWDRFT
jgi:hypothetical protein